MESVGANLPAMIWFALTGLLVIAEVFSLTFYMLALALGTLAGGIFAYQGSPFSQQLLAAVLLASVGGGIIWLNRRANRSSVGDDNDPDQGQVVTLVTVDPLIVHYRGADWQAVWQHGAPPSVEAGQTFHIYAKQANRLMIH
ncbi:MAG: hypothetical protein JHC38_09375 [Thiotrichales bacterium]|jgi:membrane protein implicated in regulation of membrane protease activity|nr:hypothetical protein [Thiotrichales bacterium]